MAHMCCLELCAAQDMIERGFVEEPVVSKPYYSCVKKDHMLDKMMETMLEALEVQQPWPEELHQGIGNALEGAASLISISQEAVEVMSQWLQQVTDVVVRLVEGVSDMACTNHARLNLLNHALAFLAATKSAHPQVLLELDVVFVKTCTQCLTIYERVQLVPSPEEESSTFDRVHEDKSFDLNLFAHLFAQAPPHGSRVAGVDAAPDPDYGLITLYTNILPFFGDTEKRQPNHDLTMVYHQVAVAGLQFLALTLTYLARIDVAMPAPQPAPPVKGSLNSHAPEPATSTPVGAAQAAVQALLKRIQLHESVSSMRREQRASRALSCIEALVVSMEAVSLQTTRWAAAFKVAASQKSWASTEVSPDTAKHWSVSDRLEESVQQLVDQHRLTEAVLKSLAIFFPDLQVADMVSQAKGSQTGSLAAAKAEAVALAAADAVAMAEALAAHNMGEQLLAEEEQQKTKAAAKKARRGRQKAKKQAEALKLQESKLPGPGCSALPAAVSSAENPATDVLSLFCCPITKAVMVEPVIAADGHTYERAAMQDWLQYYPTSRVTQALLPHTRQGTQATVADLPAIDCKTG
ncbi:hypothetical protein WJX82_003007 [Trebouxia sp. C0006]